MLQAIVKRYPVKVITPQFLIHAQMEPVGNLLDYLNDVNRGSVPLYEATLYDLVGKLKPSTRPLAVVRKQDFCGLYADDAEARSSVRLLKRIEKVIIHVPNLICRGEMHVGTETRLQDLFDVLIGSFFALTNTSLFSLGSLPAEFPQQADLILVHKDNVLVYYPE
jgi:hypothetical protein